LTYKAHLPRFNSQTLKEMARAWVGSSAYKLNKSGCTAAILEVLANKKALRGLFLEDQEVAGVAPTARHSARTANERRPKAAPCWVVQPNFDVIVYLDRASASLLTFIERITERRPSEGATALSRLTQATVYSGLEAGIDPKVFLTTLASASEYQLPENVRQTLSDWISQRERLVVYRSVDVLGPTRDAALAKKVVTGRSIGDQWILLAGPVGYKSLVGSMSRVINYGKPVSPGLTVAEEGLIRIDPTRADVVVRGEIPCLSEPMNGEGREVPLGGEHDWQMTRSTIQRAVRGGWTAEQMIQRLAQRVDQGLPPLLIVALRSWAAGI